ncbi:MAG: ribosome-associated translation inhibitor RaiA [Acidobacteriota bacterium]
MNIHYTGRSVTVDDEIKGYFEKKVAKLARFVDDPSEAHLILESERDKLIAELNVTHRHGDLHSKHVADHMQDAVLAVVETTAKQARRARKKFLDQRRRTERQATQEQNWPDPEPLEEIEDDEHWMADVIAAESLGDAEPKIVKTTRLSIKPMSLDEASVELQKSKNDFFVFLDSSSDEVRVLYRRKDQNFGLLAPEF